MDKPKAKVINHSLIWIEHREIFIQRVNDKNKVVGHPYKLSFDELRSITPYMNEDHADELKEWLTEYRRYINNS